MSSSSHNTVQVNDRRFLGPWMESADSYRVATYKRQKALDVKSYFLLEFNFKRRNYLQTRFVPNLLHSIRQVSKRFNSIIICKFTLGLALCAACPSVCLARDRSATVYGLVLGPCDGVGKEHG